MKVRRPRFASKNRQRTRAALFAGVALFCTAIALVVHATGWLDAIEGDTIDARFSIRGTQHPPKNIVVVAVDDATLSHINNEQWPFTRKEQGKLIERIRRQHPAAIALDIQFDAKSPGTQKESLADEVPFVNGVADANGRVVLSTTVTNGKGDAPFLGQSALFEIKQGLKMRVGFGNFGVAPGAEIRTLPYAVSHLDAFSVATAEVATGKKVPASEFAGHTNYIDYAGPTMTFPYISYWKVIAGKFPPGFFHNKIVVVGATASVLQDIHATPTDSLMPGPEVQANAIATVLRGLPLTGAPGWVNVLAILILGLTIPAISLRLGPVAATGVAFALGALYTVIAQLAFNSGTVISYVYPMLALALSGTGSLAVQLFTEAVERIRTRDLFSRFVPEDVVDAVLASADGLRLGGVQREGTVMFSDLRGFTSVAESLTPAQVIDTLNHYLSEMSDAILNHGGTLVAYMGDGIMAVFGAPLVQDDHADRALAAAVEMRDVRLPRFNAWIREQGLGEGFRMGVGLNSGHVMSGHVGSERRVEYTAVGDTTNSASRIEGMTKGTPHQLLMAESTKDALKAPPANLVFFDELPIRGRVEPVKLWSVAEPPTEPSGAPAPTSGVQAT